MSSADLYSLYATRCCVNHSADGGPSQGMGAVGWREKEAREREEWKKGEVVMCS